MVVLLSCGRFFAVAARTAAAMRVLACLAFAVTAGSDSRVAARAASLTTPTSRSSSNLLTMRVASGPSGKRLAACAAATRTSTSRDFAALPTMATQSASPMMPASDTALDASDASADAASLRRCRMAPAAASDRAG